MCGWLAYSGSPVLLERGFRYSSEGKSRSLFYSTRLSAVRDLRGAWNEVPEASYGIVQPGLDELRPFRPTP